MRLDQLGLSVLYRLGRRGRLGILFPGSKMRILVAHRVSVEMPVDMVDISAERIGLSEPSTLELTAPE